MLNKITYLQNIILTVDKNLIYTRLGYKKTSTKLSPDQYKHYEKLISKSLSYCKPSGGYLKLKILAKNPNYIKLENDIIFESIKLSSFLKDCDYAILMFGTVGYNIMDEIAKCIEREGAADALILDAVASEAADFILDYIMTYIKSTLSSSAKTLTKHRFSPGYGDLDLKYQKNIYNALNLKTKNIFLNDKYILQPEKTVLAIAGVL